ncbi:hypothetical protein HK100_012118 [Physocladia obscura]|uniref:Uncharacterized protein n=1 Tax=Physocladia obscura TaxID=109957 RepID=A0AAD5T2U1_9FUNG|nr:hypothetical protein HK100_012118 [Physocladia obscura]
MACNNEKAKGAYPDIPIVLQDRVAIIEIDENRHQYYDTSCELARYDVLQFGTATLLATKVFRFNPHDSLTVKFEFEVKLLQRVRNYVNQELDEEVPVAAVEWLYYDEGSKHQDVAKHASNSIRILPPINNLSEKLDEDIAAFCLTELGLLDAALNDVVQIKETELGGSELQCHVINCPNNPLKRKRCSQVKP